MNIAVVFAITENTGVKESYRRTFSLFGPILWVEVLILMVTAGGTVLFLIPGLIAYVWFIFSRYILIQEGKRGLAVLEQGREYVRGYWWSILIRFLLLYAPVVLLDILVLHFWGRTANLIFAYTLDLFILPLTVVYFSVLYTNLTRLKPNLVAKPKSLDTFLKVCGIVFGAVILLVVAFSLVPTVPPPAWREYVSSDGSFQVFFPAVPQIEPITIMLDDGATTTQEEYFASNSDAPSYFVGTNLFPYPISIADRKAVLTSTVTWLAQNITHDVTGVVTTSTFSSYQNGIAVDFAITLSDGTYAKGKAILIGSNFYQLFDLYDQRDYSPGDYERFINSFQINSLSPTPTTE